MEDIVIAKKLLQISQSAKSRKIDFDLSFNETKKLLNQKKCYFTGHDFDEQNNIRTFDRIDNNLGYINGNVVACTKEFNEKKGSLTVVDIVLMYNGLKRKKII